MAHMCEWVLAFVKGVLMKEKRGSNKEKERQKIKESQRHSKRDTEEVKGNVKAIII